MTMKNVSNTFEKAVLNEGNIRSSVDLHTPKIYIRIYKEV